MAQARTCSDSKQRDDFASRGSASRTHKYFLSHKSPHSLEPLGCPHAPRHHDGPVEPHNKHVSDATQFVQDSLDKGSPTAGPSGGHRAPNRRPSDACFRLVFQGSLTSQTRSRGAFSDPAPVRLLLSYQMECCRERGFRQHWTPTTHKRATEMPGNVGSGLCLARDHPPMQALNFGFRLQTTAGISVTTAPKRLLPRR